LSSVLLLQTMTYKTILFFVMRGSTTLHGDLFYEREAVFYSKTGAAATIFVAKAGAQVNPDISVSLVCWSKKWSIPPADKTWAPDRSIPSHRYTEIDGEN
jgi:hypothetical protein